MRRRQHTRRKTKEPSKREARNTGIDASYVDYRTFHFQIQDFDRLTTDLTSCVRSISGRSFHSSNIYYNHYYTIYIQFQKMIQLLVQPISYRLILSFVWCDQRFVTVFLKMWKHASNMVTPQGASTLKSIFLLGTVSTSACGRAFEVLVPAASPFVDTHPDRRCFTPWFSLWTALRSHECSLRDESYRRTLNAATKSWLREKILRQARPLTPSPSTHANGTILRISNV